MIDVYKECPILKNDFITLKQTMMEDADELLKCYSLWGIKNRFEE